MLGAISFLRWDDGLTRWGTSATLPSTVAEPACLFLLRVREPKAQRKYFPLLIVAYYIPSDANLLLFGSFRSRFDLDRWGSGYSSEPTDEDV
jgi:hypothetical protein